MATYLDFTQTNIDKKTFIEQCPDNLKFIIKNKDIRINGFKSILVNNSHLEVYLIMIVCNNDNLMIKLGHEYGFPRGFPIIWIPDRLIRTFGFYPKFDNDDRQTPDDLSEFENITSARFFKKWSGFLAQLIMFEFENEIYWSITSKNSADHTSPFVTDAKRIFLPYINKNLIDNINQNNLHICAEVLSQNDQTHGSCVLKEVPIITAIGKGSQYYLNGDKPKTAQPNHSRKNIIVDRFVDFYNHDQLISFCIKNGLPCDSAIVIENKNDFNLFINQLSSNRDFINNESFDQILDQINHLRIEGTVDHSDILGNCLEGIVLMLTDKNGQNFVKKYKFPYYTVRTMLLRKMFSNFSFNASLKDAALKFCRNWCITKYGQDYWYKFSLTAFLNYSNMVKSQTNYQLNYIDKQVGDHILISESIKEIDQNIEKVFDDTLININDGTIIVCLGPIGSGKSTIGNILSNKIKNSIHIDGDILDLTSSDVLKLGKERNDYSIWVIIRALLQGKIPIVSAGGGIFFGGRDNNFILLDKIKSTLGLQLKIILLLPHDGKGIIKLDSQYVPDKIYNDKEKVIDAVNRRVNSGEWVVDKKFIASTKNHQQAINNFSKFIADKSVKNVIFARRLLKIANDIFGYPLISNNNYGIQNNLDYSLIVDSLLPIKTFDKGSFGQVRLLTSVDTPNLQQIGHITYKFDRTNNITMTYDQISHLESLYQSNIKGTIFKLTSGNRKISLAIPYIPIHDDGSTHITIDPGCHQPVEMRKVALSLFESINTKDNNPKVSLKSKDGNFITYHLNDSDKQDCNIRILGSFCI